jgi:hypothetical protein
MWYFSERKKTVKVLKKAAVVWFLSARRINYDPQLTKQWFGLVRSARRIKYDPQLAKQWFGLIWFDQQEE